MTTLTSPYSKLFKSYLCDRFLQNKGKKRGIFSIQAGIPQGSVLGPVLFVLFTSDLLISWNNSTGMLSEDIVWQ